MNDLRSTSQALNLDPSQDPISSTPPRVRPEADDESAGSAGKADKGNGKRRRSGDGKRQSRLKLVAEDEGSAGSGRRHMSQRQSIKARAGQSGPDGDSIESRPARRRQAEDEEVASQESFPWSFDFDDEDEPEELQASTPLLSRAFRSGSR